MNISASRVISSMEEQLKLLKHAVDNQDQQAVREYTSVIEGYCRLLKESPHTSPLNQAPVKPNVQPSSQLSTPVIKPDAQPIEPQPSTEQKPGSLFDF